MQIGMSALQRITSEPDVLRRFLVTKNNPTMAMGKVTTKYLCVLHDGTVRIRDVNRSSQTPQQSSTSRQPEPEVPKLRGSRGSLPRCAQGRRAGGRGRPSP